MSFERNVIGIDRVVSVMDHPQQFLDKEVEEMDMVPDPEHRRARVERMWMAAWNEGDVDRFDDVLAPDYVRRTSGATRAHDLVALKEFILETRRGFPDTRTEIDQFLVDGDDVAIRWHSTGTHLGEYRGVPPTGRVVTLEGATFARFEHERMVETWSTWDPAAMLRTLGVLTLEERTDDSH